MSEEELKQEAKERADEYTNLRPFHIGYEEGYFDGAEPREKQIAEFTEQNTSLLTSVENLNKSVQELEAQIEKMKNCYNCDHGQNECYCNIKHSDICDLSCWDKGCGWTHRR